MRWLKTKIEEPLTCRPFNIYNLCSGHRPGMQYPVYFVFLITV